MNKNKYINKHHWSLQHQGPKNIHLCHYLYAYGQVKFLQYHYSFECNTVFRNKSILHHKKYLESSPAVASGLCLHSSFGSPISASARVGGLLQAPAKLQHQRPAARATCTVHPEPQNTRKFFGLVPQGRRSRFNSSLGKQTENNAPSTCSAVPAVARS